MNSIIYSVICISSCTYPLLFVCQCYLLTNLINHITTIYHIFCFTPPPLRVSTDLSFFNVRNYFNVKNVGKIYEDTVVVNIVAICASTLRAFSARPQTTPSLKAGSEGVVWGRKRGEHYLKHFGLVDTARHTDSAASVDRESEYSYPRLYILCMI